MTFAIVLLTIAACGVAAWFAGRLAVECTEPPENADRLHAPEDAARLAWSQCQSEDGK